MKLQDLIAALRAYHPNPDVDLVRRAYAFVRQAHEGQTRASGEPYITHVTEVALLAAKLRLDVPSIITALLHDTIEDTKATLEDLEKMFGGEVAALVDGVTKLSQVNFSSRAEAQAENFRKMLLAMAKDIRVLLVKLCDRTHNMRTLEFLSEARRQRIAQETLDIYGPLAHRLGIYWMKSELEDLSLRYLKPEIYEQIRHRVKSHREDQERYIEDVVQLITRELEQNDLHGKVSGRPKHIYSIYQKMEKQKLQFDEVHDLIAFRVLLDSIKDCYAALGAVHAAWRPVPGRFKDYISLPKPNGYRSLHTTVIGPQGHRIEIQIRTAEMHDIAERGIAAHWIYKEDASSPRDLEMTTEQFTWLKDLVESGKVLKDPHEFMSSVKADLFSQHVYVFSPRGDLIALAAGSTPIDFAYHIHSEIGHRCSGARVNGQQVPIGHELQNGDTVEILTSPHQAPSRDWLGLVATTKAKQRIRSWLKQEEQARSISVGRELLVKDLRKLKLHFEKVTKEGTLAAAAEALSCKDIETLLAEIGYGKITSSQVVSKLLPDEHDLEAKLAADRSALQKIFQRAGKSSRARTGVRVNGLDDVVCRFAHCCEPLPGDEIIGYVTRGRGVAIHAVGCPETLSLDPLRMIPVSWEENVQTQRRVTLRVVCIDRIGILAALTQAISSSGANIVSAQVSTSPERKAMNTFELNVESSKQLETVQRTLAKVQGVLTIERLRRKGEVID